MTEAKKQQVRCAIYTRKSSEEGLEQSFNSLDAQREAGEAYVKSQVGEGWNALPILYDDGGFSGGNLDRPAMQRLLVDVDAGLVDVIVVYKVDRLTRSLMDFARIVERFDAKGVSFVSVTQAFNTTTSMGRLTLNVLLSFAQFEREVTGERIRDKIAASKARGIWMGGNVPLGYDLGDRRLLVNEAEAAQVSHIFERFLALRSGVTLMHELQREGVASKRWTSRSGKERGGTTLSCGAIYYLLQNRLYLGEIVHREVGHAGDHQAIVSPELFEAVQQQLAASRKKRRSQPTRSDKCELAGLIFDAAGQPMTTTFSYVRGGRLYRYYVSGSLDPSRRPAQNVVSRLPAGPVEGLVRDAVSRLLPDGHAADWEEVRSVLRRVQLNSHAIHLVLRPDALLEPLEDTGAAVGRLGAKVAPDVLRYAAGEILLTIARKPIFRGEGVKRSKPLECTPERVDGRAMLRAAHRLLDEHYMSPLDAARHPSARAPVQQRPRHLMMSGLLAPAIQRRILDGSLAHISAELAAAAPLAWRDQLILFVDKTN